MNAVRARRLAQQGEYTRAIQALTSAGLAEQSPATTRAMKKKHPAANLPTFQPSSVSPQLTFSSEEVLKAAKSFRKGSAPGPDGLRGEHLKVALNRTTPNRQDNMLAALTRLVNVMAAGSVPDMVAPFLSGAKLHAGNKKDGGIRPIAVGNIMRRLTAKCFSYALANKAAGFLQPVQMGVAVRGGVEAIIHSVRQVVEEA